MLFGKCIPIVQSGSRTKYKADLNDKVKFGWMKYCRIGANMFTSICTHLVTYSSTIRKLNYMFCVFIYNWKINVHFSHISFDVFRTSYQVFSIQNIKTQIFAIHLLFVKLNHLPRSMFTMHGKIEIYEHFPRETYLVKIAMVDICKTVQPFRNVEQVKLKVTGK